MIVDKENTFCEELAVTGDAYATNYIDLGAARDVGNGEQLWVALTVTETFDSAGEAATLIISLRTDDNTTPSSPTTIAATETIAEATLVAGYQRFIPIPPHTGERYLHLHFDNGTEVFTAGKISAQVVNQIQKNTHYPDAI
jgi:hypothetical protein